MEMFDTKINSVYFTLKEKNFVLIDYCSSLFKDNIKLFEKYLNSLFLFGEKIKISPECKGSSEYLIKLTLSEIYNNFEITYNSDLKKAQTTSRDFILLKKRDLRKKYLNGEFEHLEGFNDVSIETAINFINDNNKVDLTSFTFFDRLPVSTRIKYSLKTLEYYFYLEIPNISSMYLAPISMNSFLLGTVEPSSVKWEKTQDGEHINIFYEYSIGINQFRRIYMVNDMSISNLDSSSKDSLALAVKKEIETNTKNKSLPNSFDYEVCVHIYNMITQEWTENPFVDIAIDEIVDAFHFSDLSRSTVAYYRKKVIESLKKLSKIHIKDIEIDENGKSSFKEKGFGSYMISYAKEQDAINGIWRIQISVPIIEDWKNDANNKVLSADYKRITNSTAKMFLFLLQGERVKSRNKDYCVSISFDDFMRHSPSPYPDVYSVKKLKDAFNELVDLKIIVDEYKFMNNTFSFKFIPLNEKEKEAYKIEV